MGAASISSREKQSHLFVTLTGFNTPSTVARYDFTAPEEQRWSTYRSTKVTGLVPEDFDARQVRLTHSALSSYHSIPYKVWYESKDGTKVPMFIVRHKSTEFDGTAPAIQYGKGHIPEISLCSWLT